MSCCVICAGELRGDEHALPCGHHEFHVGCLLEWFRRGNSSCPLCRSGPAHPPVDGASRERRLKRVARSKTAPRQLVQLVQRVYRDRARETDMRKKMRLFRTTHAHLIRECRQLGRAYASASQRAEDSRSELQHFVHRDVHVPLVPPPDSDDSDDSD